MVDKEVVTRKPHVCSRCGGTIPAGSKAHFCQFRTSHDGHGWYATIWTCIGECIQDKLDREALMAEYLAAASDPEAQPCAYCGSAPGTPHRHDCMSYYVGGEHASQ